MATKKYEQKGSLTLRSDHMDYGRVTLVSTWHAAREAEPKDHEVYSTVEYDAKNRNLHQSTYDRILDVTDGRLPISTCHETMNEIELKKDFEEKTCRSPMVDASTFLETTKQRDLCAAKPGFGSTLPHHSTEHDKRYLNTTYRTDYKYGHPYEASSIEKEEKDDNTSPNKKCHSQFTDVDDYRREGRNTWQDETGRYANSEIKNSLFKKTNPIPDRV